MSSYMASDDVHCDTPNAHLPPTTNADLYGKGYSEAPKTTFDATLFVVQLALLLQYIRWDAAHIVGFSMGGGVAAAFASSMPHLVAGKVVFVAAAGLLTVSRAATLRPTFGSHSQAAY